MQVPPPERCALRSAEVHEQLAGTAGHVKVGYLVVEDAGPWGRAGVSESGLGATGTTLESMAKAAGVKVLLMRATDRDSRRPAARRRVFAAVHRSRPRLVAFSVADPSELLSLDLAAFAGDLRTIHPDAADIGHPLLLVCAHAKRDQCCAIEGGPLARSLARTHPGQVFECSHLGGHRFAPTALSLPGGAVYGRLDLESATRALRLAESGAVEPRWLRGLSALPPAAQAADVALRGRLGLSDLGGVLLEDAVTQGDHTAVYLRTVDGERWVARVAPHANPPRPASCAKAAAESVSHRVVSLEPAEPREDPWTER